MKILILTGVLSVALMMGIACDSGGGSDNADTTDDLSEKLPNCSSCHSLPPSTGRHRAHVNGEGIHCTRCHNETIAANGTLIPGGPHDNGTKDVVFRDGGTFDGTTCNPSCHGRKNW